MSTKKVTSVRAAAEWLSVSGRVANLTCVGSRRQKVPITFQRKAHNIIMLVKGVQKSSINADYSINDRRLSMIDELHMNGITCRHRPN
jgi:hypothetical protein